MPYGVFLFSNPTEMIPENNKPTTFFKFENLRLYFKAIDFADAILALASNYSGDNQTVHHFFNKFVDVFAGFYYVNYKSFCNIIKSSLLIILYVI